MENPQDVVEEKRVSAGGRGTMLIGVLMVLFTCVYFAGAIALDSFGEKTTGRSYADMGDCGGSKTCWTEKVEFTTNNGEQITFYPLVSSFLIDFEPVLSRKPYEEYGNFEVRYFESFPQIAKIKMIFHLEEVGKLPWLVLGFFLVLIGMASSRGNRPNKPMVIDLRYLRKK